MCALPAVTGTFFLSGFGAFCGGSHCELSIQVLTVHRLRRDAPLVGCPVGSCRKRNRHVNEIVRPGIHRYARVRLGFAVANLTGFRISPLSNPAKIPVAACSYALRGVVYRQPRKKWGAFGGPAHPASMARPSWTPHSRGVVELTTCTAVLPSGSDNQVCLLHFRSSHDTETCLLLNPSLCLHQDSNPEQYQSHGRVGRILHRSRGEPGRISVALKDPILKQALPALRLSR